MQSLMQGSSKSNPKYITLAKKLHGALVRKGIKSKPNIDKWALEFEKLHEKNGVSLDKIKSVLKWYMVHIRQKDVPKAYSAGSFCKWFPKFERLAQKQSIQETPITKSAWKVYDLLGEPYFPWERKPMQETRHQILVWIQASLTNYRAFLKALDRVVANDPSRFHEHIRGLIDDSAVDHIASFCNMKLDWLCRWEKWNRDLTNHVWNISDKDWEKSMVEEIIWPWANDISLWHNQLKKELSKLMKV